ncbi:asparagine synthase (glutamine-hydrolyzing) [uncultured Desulfobacter sp.]|uniref:asparagine synthase (glutamine-hydrolyzing) n=1 Tax=uncultured Desulfobacter sp. TaxID=240139 RepID=UPI002AA77ECF|nr:asparagine synthase (glutamine-hydrolyzing) [uncultured Desulfobacter sp.]
MCGICGQINFDDKKIDPACIQSMMALMKHRGPDDEGMFVNGSVGLGHVRLSIIDLSMAGHQPMFSEDGRYCLIYNGEVYNYKELRKQLEHKYRFQSCSDTEVVLYSFIEWGPGCLDKFNGMFAFVIFDTKTRKLFAARDRFGIKPFYYYVDNQKFLFASEQRALLPFMERVQPNDKAVFEYLVYNRTDQGDDTFFDKIFKLPKGSYATIEHGKLKIRKWYVLEEHLDKPFQSSGDFYEAFSKSIELRLRSDVPVGVCLSGGLDSSSIVSILLKEFNKSDVNTFSAVYGKGLKADESDFIAEYQTHLKNMFFVRPTADSLLQDLDTFIQCHAEPVATLGPYAQFKVMQLAGEHVKVTLDGQGADEELAGYHYFFGAFYKELLLAGKFVQMVREMKAYFEKFHSVMAFKYLGLYMAPSFLKNFLAKQSHNFTRDGFYHSFKDHSAIKGDLYNPATLNQSLLQHFQHKLEHLLKWEDHNSMWFSLESRVPFLDYNIVEGLLSLPREQLIINATTKVILRQAMQGVLPENICNRQDKIGFATPWETWFRTKSFSDFIENLITSKAFQERGYLDPKKCTKGFQDHRIGRADIAKEIWKWINLELWYRHFINGKTKHVLR